MQAKRNTEVTSTASAYLSRKWVRMVSDWQTRHGVTHTKLCDLLGININLWKGYRTLHIFNVRNDLIEKSIPLLKLDVDKLYGDDTEEVAATLKENQTGTDHITKYQKKFAELVTINNVYAAHQIIRHSILFMYQLFVTINIPVELRMIYNSELWEDICYLIIKLNHNLEFRLDIKGINDAMHYCFSQNVRGSFIPKYEGRFSAHAVKNIRDFIKETQEGLAYQEALSDKFLDKARNISNSKLTNI